MQKIRADKKSLVDGVLQEYLRLQKLPAEREKQIWDDYLKQ